MHEPVLLNEVLQYSNLKPGDVVVDGTVGSGGHSEAFLKVIGPQGFLIGLDQDEEAIQRAQVRLQGVGKNFTLHQSNFLFLKELLTSLNITEVSAVLLDVGVSREQLESPERGFSFLREGPLDMRMNRALRQSAKEMVNRFSEGELTSIFERFGEERFARRIARRIVQKRSEAEIEDTMTLANLIKSVVPASYRYGRIHPATRVFQALRIAVNGELDVLERTLPQAFEVLGVGGRLCVITFHSLEDRIVKRFFQACGKCGEAVVLTRKPVAASEAETKRNPMARSAKLRVLERTEKHAIETVH